MREPAFWWRNAWRGLLAPVAACYGAIAARRMDARASAGVPVLCVGNFTLGGAGKTPAAMMLHAAAGGQRPFV